MAGIGFSVPVPIRSLGITIAAGIGFSVPVPIRSIRITIIVVILCASTLGFISFELYPAILDLVIHTLTASALTDICARTSLIALTNSVALTSLVTLTDLITLASLIALANLIFVVAITAKAATTVFAKIGLNLLKLDLLLSGQDGFKIFFKSLSRLLLGFHNRLEALVTSLSITIRKTTYFSLLSFTQTQLFNQLGRDRSMRPTWAGTKPLLSAVMRSPGPWSSTPVTTMAAHTIPKLHLVKFFQLLFGQMGTYLRFKGGKGRLHLLMLSLLGFLQTIFLSFRQIELICSRTTGAAFAHVGTLAMSKLLRRITRFKFTIGGLRRRHPVPWAATVLFMHRLHVGLLFRRQDILKVFTPLLTSLPASFIKLFGCRRNFLLLL